MRETPLLSSAQSVSLIEVEGNIDSVQSTFLQRQLHRAIESGSELIIFELHSPGGSLEEVRDLSLAIARLEEHGVRTAAWAPEMATGEAALGIVYQTDANAEKGVKVIGTFPEDSYPPIIYPVAQTAGSKDAETPKFLKCLQTAKARELFEGQGFTVLAPVASN